MSFSFASTFQLKFKKDNSTLVLGNGDRIPIGSHIKVHVKRQQYQSRSNCFVSKLSDGNDMMLGNDWLVEYKAHLIFNLNIGCFVRAIIK